jgi:hypothetical protein
MRSSIFQGFVSYPETCGGSDFLKMEYIKSSPSNPRPGGASSVVGGRVEVDPPYLVGVPSDLGFSVMHGCYSRALLLRTSAVCLIQQVLVHQAYPSSNEEGARTVARLHHV